MLKLLALLGALTAAWPAQALTLEGEPVQGGLMFGQVASGSQVSVDGEPLLLSEQGHFVLGFGRDETGMRRLQVVTPSGERLERPLTIVPRDYEIERVDGLPPRTVTPDPAALERIRQEARMVGNARARRDRRADFANGFIWPAQGRISGVYGSQRVLNGKPARPHFGVDIAAPSGTPVYAPADGVVTLVHPDMYYSGGTIILDHGQGLSSSFLHLSQVLVEAGLHVAQGDLIGRIGMTGRASGPHLDWRMNWLDRRVDPQQLVNTRDGQTSP